MSPMKNLPTFAATLWVALALHQPQALAADAAAAIAVGTKPCETLQGRRIGQATIEKAEWFKRGDPLVGLAQRTALKLATKGKIQLDATTDFCKITAKARPAPGSQITLGVWLPQPWNGKLMGSGGFGFNGGLMVAGFTSRQILAQGYAVLATDAGHEEPAESLKFAYRAPEALKDYGFRSNHVGTEFAKALIAAYYAKPVQRAYFHGCSNGGRDALMLAQRFPEDYDGIIAGAPAADFTNLMSRFNWNRQIAAGVPKLGEKLKLISDAVIAQCDALDGIKDGLLDNPLNCAFQPAALQCKDGEGARCLSAAEVDAVRKLYAGPRLSDGRSIYPGQPVGAEALPGGWDGWMLGAEATVKGAEDYFRWVVYGDPDWNLGRFDLARDPAVALQRNGPVLNATDPDLSAFMRRGGKLLMYHGWNDVAIPAGATLDYYAAMRKAVGPIAGQQARLFMIPGLLHCGGGPGANYFDKLAEMDRWVETGTAPDRIVAAEYDSPVAFSPLPDAKKIGTRPLCPWPKVAKYQGSGASNDAANFKCQ